MELLATKLVIVVCLAVLTFCALAPFDEAE
jgi:hypothetical protein